jgi:hypothetical protein
LRPRDRFATLRAMAQITLDGDRRGLDGFPAGFTVLGRDDLGDVLAADAKGVVWSFPHGGGDWTSRIRAFASTALLHEHVAFQRHFAPPAADEPTDALKARKQALEAWRKGRRSAPYSLDASKAAIETLREELADRRFHASKRGRGLAACQELGQRCEQALRAAGALGEWIARAAAADGSALGVMGDFAPPWTEARVRALLAPLVGPRELRLLPRPRPKP